MIGLNVLHGSLSEGGILRKREDQCSEFCSKMQVKSAMWQSVYEIGCCLRGGP